MIEIRQEDILEQKETENVVREAFWNVYTPGCCEHFLVHKIRRCHAFVHQLNLVALSSGMIVGHVINIKSYIEGDDGSCHEILCLGPISVLPQFQRQGVGSALIAMIGYFAQSDPVKRSFYISDSLG
ncbi:GNAT family N-acetyltransferase [Succinatimonas hippei]|uniref:GNAT family N-acetyltransferase n=1 Tax=Succinatimonas hippei TaxID=626938 RepID=UPI0011DC8950|nr:GNAT family N-acetyltransferase [Succinatimonas hippei]